MFEVWWKVTEEMNMKKIFIITCGSLLLQSCASSSTGPVSVGVDTYILSRQSGAFPTGSEPLLIDAINESKLTCSSQGKKFKLITTSENTQIIGNFPKATVTFSCE